MLQPEKQTIENPEYRSTIQLPRLQTYKKKNNINRTRARRKNQKRKKKEKEQRRVEAISSDVQAKKSILLFSL